MFTPYIYKLVSQFNNKFCRDNPLGFGEELKGQLGTKPHRLGYVIHILEDIESLMPARSIGLDFYLGCNVVEWI